MAKVADEILVNIQVNKSQADREVRSWQTQYNRSMDGVQGKTRQTEAQIKRSTGQISGHLKALAGAIAAGASLTGLQKMADGYTVLQNRLRVVGLEGQAMAEVQDRLFEAGNRNGVAVNDLAQLYSRMALSANELGASETQLLSLIDGVSASLRVQGVSAQAAAGPMLQLGQAMGAGVVRAEEINSILEGVPVIAQAAARGFEAAGGSVSRFRTLVLDGKVSSQEFFQALLKGFPQVEEQAKKSNLTIGQSLTTLQNEMLRYIGQMDQSLSASQKFVGAIGLLADNLDKIAPAIGVIAAVLGGRFTAGLIGSAAATIRQTAAFERAGGAALVAAASYDRLTASTARMATASEIAAVRAAFAAGQLTRMQIAAATAGNIMGKAGRSILDAFGGPVGLAVTGLSIALMGLASESMDADADISGLNTSIEHADALIRRLNPVAEQASSATADIGSEASTATPKIDSFAGAVGRAAQQLWELAKAKQAAALAELSTERQAVSEGVAAAQQRTRQGRRQAMSQELTGGAASTIGEQWNRGMRYFVGEIRDIWSGGDYNATQEQAVSDGLAALGRLDDAIRQTSTDLEKFAKEDAKPAAPPADTDTKGGKSAARSAQAAADRLVREQERDDAEALQRQRAMEDDLFRLGDAMLSAMMERQLTAQDRLDLDLEALKRDRDANSRMIEREVIDGDKTRTQADVLVEMEEAVYNERVANRTRQAQQEIREEQLNAEGAVLDLQLEMLGIQSGTAKTAAEARRLQLEILRLQQQRVRDEVNARIDADPSLDGPAILAQLAKTEQAQTAAVIQQTQDPLEAWFDATMQSAEQVKEAYQRVAADGLEAISGGIADIVTGAKSAKEAFKDMAMSILADIARIESRKLVSSLFGAILPGFGGSSVPIPGHAEGGWIGGRGTGTSDSNLIRASKGEFMVKEKQAKKYKSLLEAMNADRLPGYRNGGFIGAVGSAGSIPGMSGGGLTQHFYIDAKGAILADALMDEMHSLGAVQASQAGLGAVSYTQGQQQRSAQRQRKRFV